MRKAFVALSAAALFLATSAPADAQERRFEEKNPAIALGFAWLCPGCGHFYTGETTKGAVIATVSVGSMLTGMAIQFSRSTRSMNDLHGRCRLASDPFDCAKVRNDFTPILVGGAIGLAGYLYGLIDAGPSARRMNERNGGGFGALDIRPHVAEDGSVRTQLGIRLAAPR